MVEKVLVTGGLGVIGSCVVGRLVERGLFPIVLDIRPDFSLLAPGVKDKIAVHQGDFTDAATLDQVFGDHGVEAVVHLGVKIAECQEDPLSAAHINIMGTVGLLDAARRHGAKRFIFASSRGAYGETVGENAAPDYVPIKETNRLNGQLVYSVCKTAGEGFGRHYAKQFGLEFVALRFGTTFGPGRLARHGTVPGVMTSLIENPFHARPVEIPTGGDQVDDIIYNEDIADAIALAVLHPKPKYTEYNIARGVGVRLGDVADAVRKLRPEADISIGPGLNYLGIPENISGVLDVTRATEDLGFKVRFDLEAAVRDYYARMEALDAWNVAHAHAASDEGANAAPR